MGVVSKRIKLLTRIFCGFFFILIFVQLLVFIAEEQQEEQQFAWDLSMMDRADALMIVFRVLNEQGLMYSWLTERQAGYLANTYLDEVVGSVLPFTRIMLSAKLVFPFGIVGKWISGITLSLLLYSYLSESKADISLNIGGNEKVSS